MRFTHYRALEACNEPQAEEQLQACVGWVMNVADSHCPPEFRQSFLTRNSVNCAILKAAEKSRLEPAPLGAD